MEAFLDILSTIGIFILAILILVFIHELGHFLAAKLFGMRVERFSLGMPPRIFGVQVGETDYCISATPLGGYVKISGMIDESMDVEYLEQEPQPHEFRSKPVWQRIIVITAGVIFNMILAAFIYVGINWTYGEAKLPINQVDGFYIEEGSLPDKMGLKTGDKIIAINGRTVDYFDDLTNPSVITSNTVTFTAERNGEQFEISAPDNFIDYLNKGDYLSLINVLPSKISNVINGSLAASAGLEAGDEIIEIDGTKINFWLELVTLIKESEGAMAFKINRSNEIIEMEITPNPETKMIGIAPVDQNYFKVERFNYGFFHAITSGTKKTGEITVGIVQGFIKLLSGDISVKDNLGGPVAIANFTKQATDLGGIRGFWEITALLSITLAIMNILPIPVLDGGHLMFLIYEGITRREPSPKIRMALQQIGFVLIIGLIIFVTFNDIMRQFGF